MITITIDKSYANTDKIKAIEEHLEYLKYHDVNYSDQEFKIDLQEIWAKNAYVTVHGYSPGEYNLTILCEKINYLLNPQEL